MNFKVLTSLVAIIVVALSMMYVMQPEPATKSVVTNETSTQLEEKSGDHVVETSLKLKIKP